jgi:hypothetical protein
MQKAQCGLCGKTVPLNDSITVMGQPVCVTCAEREFEENPEYGGGDITANIDPTVCAKCGKDGGLSVLEKVMEYPVCPECALTVKNYPFPRWIKLSALGLAALVVLSFVLNIRFIQANSEIEGFFAALDVGDYQQASLLSESAAARVPEIADFRYLNHYSTALVLLDEGNPRQALDHLEKCRLVLPQEYMVEDIIRNTRLGMAFDEADYDKFLALAREDYDAHPNNRNNILVMASAFAAKYAETGNDAFKKNSSAMLEKYRGISGEEDLDDYENRILHRLYTREILSSEDFASRYPLGWDNPEGDW